MSRQRLNNALRSCIKIRADQGDPISVNNGGSAVSVRLLSKEIVIPGHILTSWQKHVDLIASLLQVSAARIMRAAPPRLETLVSSHTPTLKPNDTITTLPRHYCHQVLHQGKQLIISNALDDPSWTGTIDLQRGLIAYCGMPLYWPDGQQFGTISILDHKTRHFSEQARQLLERFCDAIELSLETLFQANRLKQKNRNLAQQIDRRADELDHLNRQLDVEISGRASAEQTAQLLTQAIEQSPLTLLIADTNGQLEYANRAEDRRTYHTLSQRLLAFPPVHGLGHSAVAELKQHLRRGEKWQGDFQRCYPDGSTGWESANVIPIRDDNQQLRQYLAIIEDITERRQQQAQLYRQACYDPLTGLPNRQQLKQHISYQLQLSQQHQFNIAVIVLGLDHFKKVNDSLGHPVGDAVLIETASRLQNLCQALDSVGRLGDDEFVVIQSNSSSIGALKRRAQQILNTFNDVFEVANRQLSLTISIGIALSPYDGTDAEELLRNASAAMNHSKRTQRHNYRFYREHMNLAVSRRLEIEEHLRNALANNEMEVVYQPLIDLSSRLTVGAEALIRWHNPTLGQVSPEEFTAVAEQSGDINALGMFVLKQTLYELDQWRDVLSEDFRLAVNFSPVQLRQKGLVEAVEQALHQHQLPASLLEIEVTEGVFLREEQHSFQRLTALKKLGVRLSLDDFGTGYSSLSYLQKYPFDTLKVDQEFIHQLTTSPPDKELVKAIIAMADKLRLDIIAEGIENEEQLTFLQAEHCTLGQGYFFSNPLTGKEFHQRLLQPAHNPQ